MEAEATKGPCRRSDSLAMYFFIHFFFRPYFLESTKAFPSRLDFGRTPPPLGA